MHGLWAAVLISVVAYFPFVYLPIAAALRRLDPAMEDAAASLGYGPWAVFFKVVLPQLRLAIWGGALLVGLGVYGLIVQPQPLRKILAFNVVGSGVFLLFGAIAYRGAGAGMGGDPVPQALLITGIVVAFSATALAVLTFYAAPILIAFAAGAHTANAVPWTPSCSIGCEPSFS